MTKYSLVQTGRTTVALVALRPDGEMGHLIAEGTREEMEAQLALTLLGDPTEVLGIDEVREASVTHERARPDEAP